MIMSKVKIAPNLERYLLGIPGIKTDPVWRQFRALLSVIREVQSWMQYGGWVDGVIDRGKEWRQQDLICAAIRRLERLSKGARSCHEK